jgi:effector-binding domain-containing protein
MSGYVGQAIRDRPLDDIEVVNVAPRLVAGLCRRVALRELSSFFAEAIPAVVQQLGRAGVPPVGPPMAVYRSEHGDTFAVTAGFPVERAPSGDPLVHEHLPGGSVVRSMHVGPYATLPEVYHRLSKWFADRNLTPPEVMWEEYLIGPDAAGESRCRTRVVYPLG